MHAGLAEPDYTRCRRAMPRMTRPRHRSNGLFVAGWSRAEDQTHPVSAIIKNPPGTLARSPASANQAEPPTWQAHAMRNQNHADMLT